ncbi:GP3 protein [RtClan arterivirus]|uniref:GP3 protein n=1 Tax=RtClan arterivirus TaxID=2847271 RepID=A0A2H4MWQ8_9NIDO|nr:GP3 protein [Rodent arterivirus]ATP66647.1 GP3 protein [RtClan arterivirus]
MNVSLLQLNGVECYGPYPGFFANSTHTSGHCLWWNDSMKYVGDTLHNFIPEEDLSASNYVLLAVLSFVHLAFNYPLVLGLENVTDVVMYPKWNWTSYAASKDDKKRGIPKEYKPDYVMNPYADGVICARHQSQHTTLRNMTHNMTKIMTFFKNLSAESEVFYRKEWVRPFFSCWLVLWVSIALRRMRAGHVTVRLTRIVQNNLIAPGHGILANLNIKGAAEMQRSKAEFTARPPLARRLALLTSLKSKKLP